MQLYLYSLKTKMKENIKIRSCLRCLKGFKSFGFGNRICKHCLDKKSLRSKQEKLEQCDP